MKKPKNKNVGKHISPICLDNAEETVVGIGSDSEKYGVGISSTHITGIQSLDKFVHAVGGVKDTSGD